MNTDDRLTEARLQALTAGPRRELAALAEQAARIIERPADPERRELRAEALLGATVTGQ